MLQTLRSSIARPFARSMGRSLAMTAALAALAVSAPHRLGAQALPAASELVAKHLTAIGGAEAFKSITSLRQSGVMEMPSMGLQAQAENYAAAPNKMSMKASIPGIGEIVSGTNGDVAWQVNPMQGPRLLEEKELVDAREAADFYGNMLLAADRFSKMETVGVVSFAGEQAYQVKFTRKGSGRESTQYFSVASGLLIGSEATQESAMGSTTMVTVLGDYKDFAGRKFPTRSEAMVGPSKIVLKISEVSVNDVPDTAFAVPDAVKTLIKK